VTRATRKVLKRLSLLLLCACLSLALLLRVYHQVIPWGAPFLPYLFSTRGAVLDSPDGRVRLRVMFNDAGAAHSGNHWTWIIRDSWLLGPRVVAEGYSDARFAVDREPFPAIWTSPRDLAVDFLSGRYGEAMHRSVVSF
jgi:hypothetical protein